MLALKELAVQRLLHIPKLLFALQEAFNTWTSLLIPNTGEKMNGIFKSLVLKWIQCNTQSPVMHMINRLGQRGESLNTNANVKILSTNNICCTEMSLKCHSPEILRTFRNDFALLFLDLAVLKVVLHCHSKINPGKCRDENRLCCKGYGVYF